jgi:hypothetical protein
MLAIMSRATIGMLHALIVSGLGSGTLLHGADAQLPASPFLVPQAGKPGAGNTPALAASPDDGPQFSGFVDTTYNYDLNRPASRINRYYSFDSQANTFALNNAQLEVTGPPKGDAAITYMLKIDYGTDAPAASSTVNGVSTGTSQLDVEEAWGWYVDPLSKVGLKVGKFAAFDGIEDNESISDPTITRGLLFSIIEAGSCTGVLLTWKGTVLAYAVGVVNGWDELTASDTGKTLVAKMDVTLGDPLTVTVSGMYGPQGSATPGAVNFEPVGPDSNKRGALGITGSTKVIPTVQLNFQADFGWEKNAPLAQAIPGAAPNSQSTWIGFGVQPLIAITAVTNLGIRIEVLDDRDGARTGVKQEIWSFTIAPGIAITPHVLLRAEARLDVSNATSYVDHSGTPIKLQATLASEAIYSY